MALKEVRNRIWGVPWDLLGDAKIIRESKKWGPKIDQNSE